MTHRNAEEFELRVHDLAPGALPGFRAQAARRAALVARHGQPAPVAEWESLEGDRHVALVRWSSLDDALRCRQSLLDDAEYAALSGSIDAASPPAGRLHLTLMRPSPAWDAFPEASSAAQGLLHELRVQHLTNRFEMQAHEELKQLELPLLAQHGATVLGVFSVLFGEEMPQAITFLGWPDLATRQRALAALESNIPLARARARELRQFGSPLFGNCAVTLMRATVGAASRSLRAGE